MVRQFCGRHCGAHAQDFFRSSTVGGQGRQFAKDLSPPSPHVRHAQHMSRAVTRIK